MDVTTMTLEQLRAALIDVRSQEDVFGRPDIHTEDWICDEIERRVKHWNHFTGTYQ